jgi:hypothetical protein
MSSTPESVHRVRVDAALGIASPRAEVTFRPGSRVVDSPASRLDGVAMVASVGRLEDVVDDLRQAVLLALADEPRVLVCDLSAVLDGRDADARILVETAGQQVRDWPALPVLMACPDPALRQRLRQQPMSEHVQVPASIRHALAAAGRVASPTIVRRQLAPRPTASRLARDFVSRTCLDWGLAQGIASACLVVSELVNNGLRHAVTDMDLALARHGGLLRLALRDRGAEPSKEPARDLESVSGRGLSLIDACSRAWGVLPAADGGKVVWAVLQV